MNHLILEQIKELEQTAKLLEPDAKAREVWRNPVIEYTENFLNNAESRPVFQQTPDEGAGLYQSPLSEDPTSIHSLLQLLQQQVDKPGTDSTSSRYLGYIPGGGLYPSALGDYLADVSNRFVGNFFSSPGAVRMENLLIRWLCDLVGYPAQAFGNLTSGGSTAHLSAIVSARDAKLLKAKDYHRAVIYLTEQVHHSVTKALHVAGLAEVIKRIIPIDQKCRMQSVALQESITADQSANLIPWLILASAGTTNTGAIDPIKDIGKIANTHNLWLHIDAAYGGFFLLSATGKTLLTHLNLADSLILDPHKGLFLPYGTGAVLMKDRRHLLKSFSGSGDYLQETLIETGELSPADLSLELSRPFRGMRMWLPLKLFGLAPFRAGLEEKLLLARYFYNKINLIPGIETISPPELSVVAFRYRPAVGDADEFNHKLVALIRLDARVFFSSTRIHHKVYLRMACLCFHVHLKDIDLALSVLQEKIAEQIEKNKNE